MILETHAFACMICICSYPEHDQYWKHIWSVMKTSVALKYDSKLVRLPAIPFDIKKHSNSGKFQYQIHWCHSAINAICLVATNATVKLNIIDILLWCGSTRNVETSCEPLACDITWSSNALYTLCKVKYSVKQIGCGSVSEKKQNAKRWIISQYNAWIILLYGSLSKRLWLCMKWVCLEGVHCYKGIHNTRQLYSNSRHMKNGHCMHAYYMVCMCENEQTSYCFNKLQLH